MRDHPRIAALRRSFQTICSGKYIVFAATIAGIVFGAAGNQLQTPVYHSSARMQIAPQPSANTGAVSNAADSADHFEAQLHRLDSPQLHLAFAELMRRKAAWRSRSVDSIVRELETGLQIHPLEEAGSVDLVFTAEDPGKAAEWLNAYLDVADQDRATQRQLVINPLREALRAKLDDIKKLIAAQQEQINSHSGDPDRQNGQENNSVERAQLRDLKRAYDEALSETAKERQKLKWVEQCLSSDAGLANVSDLDFAPDLRAHAQKVTDIVEVLGRMWLEGGDEEHLRSLAAEMKLQDLKDQFKTELEKTAENLRARISVLESDEQSALDSYTREASARSGSARSREMSRVQEISGDLLKAASALEEKLGSLDLPANEAAVSIKKGAIADPNPTVKGGFPFVIVMGVAGFVLSAGFLGLYQVLKPQETALQPVQRSLEAPVYQSFSGSATFNLNRLRESCNALKALLGREAHGCRSVMIASSLPKEGRTTIAFSLARSLAGSGSRTVLVDFDLRKPRVEHLKKADEVRHKNRMFSPVTGLNMCLETTNCPTLHMIVPAEVPEYLPLILHQPRINELIQYLRSRYDWVIIDTPPITSARDAVILGPLFDAVLFVVKQNLLDRKIVKSSMASLNEAHAKIVGKVVNDFGLHRPGSQQFGYFESTQDPCMAMSTTTKRVLGDFRGDTFATPDEYSYAENVGKLKRAPETRVSVH